MHSHHDFPKTTHNCPSNTKFFTEFKVVKLKWLYLTGQVKIVKTSAVYGILNI